MIWVLILAIAVIVFFAWKNNKSVVAKNDIPEVIASAKQSLDKVEHIKEEVVEEVAKEVEVIKEKVRKKYGGKVKKTPKE
jgi:septum formation topological specificity factor MinE